MFKSSHIACFLLLSLGIHASAAHADESKSEIATEKASYEKQIEALTSKYEAFQIATEADPAFPKNWLNKLRITSATKPELAATPNFTLSVGDEILIGKINPYLRRSDDESTIAYFQVLSKLVAMGTTDETFCKSFLNMSDKSSISDSDNARMERAFGSAAIYEEITTALGKVMRSGKSGEERVLTKDESESLILEMATIMIDKYGKESVAGLAAFNEKDTPPIKKCATMAEMLAAIALLEKPQQASLIRTLFASSDK